MSRTIRRKNYDKQGRSTSGSKIAGAFTEYDWVDNDCTCGHCRGGCSLVYRAPTANERIRRFLTVFTDKGSGEQRFNTMPQDERKIEQKTHRGHARQAIHAYLRGRQEDVILSKNPKFPSWWW